jgi:hypothetical protein
VGPCECLDFEPNSLEQTDSDKRTVEDLMPMISNCHIHLCLTSLFAACLQEWYSDHWSFFLLVQLLFFSGLYDKLLPLPSSHPTPTGRSHRVLS